MEAEAQTALKEMETLFFSKIKKYLDSKNNKMITAAQKANIS
jgi:hypothetical protein